MKSDIIIRSGIWAIRLAIPIAWLVGIAGVVHFKATLDTAVGALAGLDGTEEAVHALKAKFWFYSLLVLGAALLVHGLLAVLYRYLVGSPGETGRAGGAA